MLCRSQTYLQIRIDLFRSSCNNKNMNHTAATPESLNAPAVREADLRAVIDHFISHRPLDPVVSGRVLARAETIAVDVCRRLGETDTAVELVRAKRDGQDISQSGNLTAMTALLLEIEYLRDERALYLDALYAAKRAEKPIEPLPSLDELISATTNRVNFKL
jgi:hypothetical protein